MKRILTILVLLLCATLLFAACNGDSTDPTNPTTPTESESVSVSESQSESVTESNATTESIPETDSESNVPTDTESNADSVTESDPVADTETESDAPIASESESNVETESASESVTESETETETDAPAVCQHTGGTATCQSPAICELCGETYGDIGTHSGTQTCYQLPTCATCGETFGEILPHTYDGDCDEVCNVNRCKAKREKLAAHTFENAICTVCGFDYKYIPIVESAATYVPFNNFTEVTVETTDEDGTYLKVVTTSNADPYFHFNIYNYTKRALNWKVRDGYLTGDYKVFVMRVKATDCTPSSICMYFTSDKQINLGPFQTAGEFIAGSDGWHYIFLDMSDCETWKNNITMIRIDLDGASSPTNTILISEFTGHYTMKDAFEYMGVDVSSGGNVELTPDQEAERDELISGKAPVGSYEDYKGETAANEDSDINLWFEHINTRTPQNYITPGELWSYKLMLAKNETEGCQLILSTKVEKTGLTIEMSDFIHSNGTSTMKSELLQGYYFRVEGQDIIDPLPPAGVGNFATFDIGANRSQTFVVKACADKDTVAGEYTATVIVKDANGNEIKKVTVFAYVWNFTLPDASSCKTLMDLGSWDLYVLYQDYAGEYPLYENYYNFLLDYRVCAYDVPGMKNQSGRYDSKVMQYLNNPRVVAFINLGWEDNKDSDFNATNLQNSYNSLTNSDGTPKLDAEGNSILDKAHFYPVDEPGSQSALDRIINAANLIKENFSTDYNLIAPMHINNHVYHDGGIGDFFSYLAGAVTSWCPKTFFFNTMSEYINNPTIEQGTSMYIENKLGLFKDRMLQEQAGGDEIWWYVTRKPNDPEITLGINQDATEYRILFWQQKLYNVDGFLYYLCNDWRPASDGALIENTAQLQQEFAETMGWYSKHEIGFGNEYSVYGNGVLIYLGKKVADDYYNAVGSLRLELVRDGIEDYEYFTMLEELIGKEKVDLIISTITTSVTEYTCDADLFMQVREAVGVLLETEINK